MKKAIGRFIEINKREKKNIKSIMCGIFYIKTTKDGRIKIEEQLDYIIEKIKYRGPDKTNKMIKNDFFFVHTLLAIQGFNPQPTEYKNRYLIFNGEIYGTSNLNESTQNGKISYKNIQSQYKSENEFLHKYFEQYNFNKLEDLDGEFVINYVDFDKKILHIITDPFGTKPFCFYGDNVNFIGSSYESCVRKSMDILGLEGNINFVIPNTHYQFSLNDNRLVKQDEILQWDFNPRYSNFDRWNIAFENSLRKRTNTDKGIFIPLSSGYDSGCIVSGMINLGKKFKTYTFEGKEDIKTLESRKKLIERKNSFYYINPKVNIEKKYEEYCKRIENYTAYHFDGKPYSDIYDAYSCFGIYQIFQDARKDKQIIFLSGHGGDEIFSDYGNIENRSASILEMDYTDVRSKWPNFDSAYGRNILQMFERVGGCFGIESRYPFLDKQVVQEFLWLSDKLKNKEFKQCIAQYMRKDSFPFLEKKKCSVRVLTDKDGGNNEFFKTAKNIKNKLNIETKRYPVYKDVNKNQYRPINNNKPIIEYYPN